MMTVKDGSSIQLEISTGEQVKNGGNQQRLPKSGLQDAFNDIKGEKYKIK